MHLHIIFWSTITYMLYKEFSLSLISKAMLAAESENKYLSKKCANEECNSPSQAWRSQRKCLTGGKDQADAGKPELPQMGQKHVESEISVIHPTELKLRKLLYVLGANTGNYQSIYKDKRTIQKKKKKEFKEIFPNTHYFVLCAIFWKQSYTKVQSQVRPKCLVIWSPKTHWSVTSYWVKTESYHFQLDLLLKYLASLSCTIFFLIQLNHPNVFPH